MFKKTISVVLLLTVLCGVFFACDPPDEDDAGFLLDQVVVTIKEEFMEKVIAEEFTVEDFRWSNAERIEYHHLLSLNLHYLTVYLKKHGKKRVLDAIAHFNTLDFVEEAGTNGIVRPA